MDDFFKTLGGLAIAIIVVVAIAFGAFAITAYFNPKYEAVRRTTYEQSRAFQEGTVRDLENLQIEWSHATPAQKDALRAVILHRLADVPPGLLTANLIEFSNQVRSAQ